MKVQLLKYGRLFLKVVRNDGTLKKIQKRLLKRAEKMKYKYIGKIDGNVFKILCTYIFVYVLKILKYEETNTMQF